MPRLSSLRGLRAPLRHRHQLGFESLELRALLAITPISPVLGVSAESTARSPVVAADAAGGFVVAWEEEVSELGVEIRAQRFDADGLLVGDLIEVNVSTTGDQYAPAIDMAPNGAFVITWSSLLEDGEGAAVQTALARRFQADGTPESDDIPVTPEEVSTDFVETSVAINTAGDFVVAWSITGDLAGHDQNALFARRYDAAGEPIDDPILIDAQEDVFDGNPTGPTVALLANRSFVVGWRSGSNSGSAQGFDSDGNPVGDATQLPGAENIAIAADSSGNFVGVIDDLVSVVAQRFDAEGNPLSAPFTLAEGGDDGDVFVGLRFSGIDMDGNGNFAIVWQRVTETPSDNTLTVVVQAFGANGAAIDGPVEVASSLEEFSLAPDVAVRGAGEFAVAFERESSLGDGISAQLFGQEDDEPTLPPDDGEFDADYIADLYQALLGRTGSSAEIDSWLDTPGMTAEAAVLGFLNSAEYNRKFVRKLYQQYLGREADAGGLDYWAAQLNEGREENEILAGILASAEYFDRQGDANDDFVAALYRDLLGRTAGAAEIDSWLAVLAGGATRRSVVLGFVNSLEYRGLLVSDPADALSYAGWYQDYLNRDAEPAGRDYWANELAKKNTTWRDVQRNILLSEEFFLA